MPTFKDPAFRGEAHDTILVPSGVVELRVHGVNGGTPKSNLHDPHPIQITGDDLVGIYRRRPSLTTDDEPARTVEAYNWSAINSSISQRVWWVFLLPFAFANLAGWLLPRGIGNGRRGFAQCLIRLVGLAVTSIVVLGMAEAFIDLIAVQCGGSVVCHDTFWLGWLDWIVGLGELSTEATQRAVVFTLVPLAGLTWIGWMGRRTGRYENYGAPTAEDNQAHGPRMDGITLSRAEFWQAPHVVSIQRRLHMTAGLGLLTGTLAMVLRELSEAGSHHDRLLKLGWAGYAIVVFAAFSLVGSHWLRQIPSKKIDTFARIPYYAGLALLLATGVVGWFTPSQAFDAPPLEAVRNGLIFVTAVGLALVVLIGMLVRAPWPFLGTVVLGVLAFLVSWHWAVEGEKHWYWGESATLWLWVEAVVAAVFVLRYKLMGPPEEGTYRRTSTLWIYFGAGMTGVAGVAVFLRDPGRWWLAVLILVAYLASQFAIQIRRGDDQPASEEMRVGMAAIVAGLALTTALTLTAGAAVFVAQRLGAGVAHSGGPVVAAGVEAFIVRADVRIIGSRISITGDLEGGNVPSGLEPYFEQEVIIHGTLMLDTRVADDFIRIESGVGSVDCPQGEQDTPCLAGWRLDLGDLAARGEDDQLVVRGAFVTIDSRAVTVHGRAIFYPAELGWYSVAALFGFAVFGLSLLLRLLILYLFRWGSIRGYHKSWGKGPDLSREYDEEWDQLPNKEGKYSLDDARRQKRFSKQSTRYRLFANLTDDADWLITSAVITTLALLIAIVAMRFNSAVPANELTSVVGLASLVLAFSWIALIWLVREAKENLGLRRQIGMLWDVTAFFPRRFHPLAPPCYAEQSVIDIRDRIVDISKAGGRMVIVAHSEGTMLTAAALMTLNRPDREAAVQRAPGHPDPTGDELEHLYYVTYGCMLRRLFGRAWPDQLPLNDLVGLKRRLGDDTPSLSEADPFPHRRKGKLARWINFGRYTDYLGGRVFSPLQAQPTGRQPLPEREPERCDDIFFRDPTRRWRYSGQSEFAQIWTHSYSYESDMEDPRFRQHVWDVVRTLTDSEFPATPVRPLYQPCRCHPEEA